MGSLLISQAHAQTPNTEDTRLAGLDTTFNGILKTWQVPGFAVAIVQKDKVIYAKGFGYRDYEQKIPVTPNTLFAIGSTTKAFTAGLMGLLRQDGKLDFEQPVRRFLPELVFSTSELNEHVTLRDMMSHRTGIARFDEVWEQFSPGSRDSLLYRIRYMPPKYPLRTTFQYNNLMFVAQGATAEKLTGKSWESNIQQRFFDRLDMHRSNFDVNLVKKDSNAALPYYLDDKVIAKIDYKQATVIGPAGSINSTVLDMANWISMWIHGGKYKDSVILPEGYVREAMSAQMPMSPNLPSLAHPDINSYAYGLGWMLRSYRGHYQVYHGGNIDGFTAGLSFFPMDSIGIIVLACQDHSVVPELVKNIVSDKLLGLSTLTWNDDWVKHYLTGHEQPQPVASKTKYPAPVHPVKDLAGVYSNKIYGILTVFTKNDSLYVTVGEHTALAKHVGYDIYSLGISRAQFLMDYDGKITRLEIEGDDDPLSFNKL